MLKRIYLPKWTNRWLPIALFIGPVMLYYLGFMVYPFFATFYYSFNTIAPVKGVMVTTFVGFQNYMGATLKL